jgi:hypothetical protein
MDVYKSAIKLAKEKEYFTGGFDIMKKLFKKQHKHQDIRKKGAVHWGDPDERRPTPLTKDQRILKDYLSEHYKKQNKNMFEELKKWREKNPRKSLADAINALSIEVLSK